MFLSFDGNQSHVKLAIAALDQDDLTGAFQVLENARRDIFSGTIVQTTTHKGAPPKSAAHPDMSNYRTLDAFLDRAQQMVSGSDTAGARAELQAALQTFGWT
jgi:hypothetical protein